MRSMAALLFAFLSALASAIPAQAADSTIAIVAAQNFYGDIARQIGGDRVSVASIMSNPDQDPHLKEMKKKQDPDPHKTNADLQPGTTSIFSQHNTILNSLN